MVKILVVKENFYGKVNPAEEHLFRQLENQMFQEASSIPEDFKELEKEAEQYVSTMEQNLNEELLADEEAKEEIAKWRLGM